MTVRIAASGRSSISPRGIPASRPRATLRGGHTVAQLVYSLRSAAKDPDAERDWQSARLCELLLTPEPWPGFVAPSE